MLRGYWDRVRLQATWSEYVFDEVDTLVTLTTDLGALEVTTRKRNFDSRQVQHRMQVLINFFQILFQDSFKLFDLVHLTNEKPLAGRTQLRSTMVNKITSSINLDLLDNPCP